MSNKFKGEIETATGHKMILDMNAMANLEDITGKKALDIVADIEALNASVSDIRAFYWACLIRNHPEITLAEAGEVYTQDTDAFIRVLTAAVPQAPAGSVEGNAKARSKRA